MASKWHCRGRRPRARSRTSVSGGRIFGDVYRRAGAESLAVRAGDERHGEALCSIKRGVFGAVAQHVATNRNCARFVFYCSVQRGGLCFSPWSCGCGILWLEPTSGKPAGRDERALGPTHTPTAQPMAGFASSRLDRDGVRAGDALANSQFVVGGLVLIRAGPWLLQTMGSRTLLLPTLPLLALSVITFLEVHHSQYASLVMTENWNPFVPAPALLSGIIASAASFWLAPRLGVAGILLSQGVVQLAFNNWWPVLRAIRGLSLSPLRGVCATLLSAQGSSEPGELTHTLVSSAHERRQLTPTARSRNPRPSSICAFQPGRRRPPGHGFMTSRARYGRAPQSTAIGFPAAFAAKVTICRSVQVRPLVIANDSIRRRAASVRSNRCAAARYADVTSSIWTRSNSCRPGDIAMRRLEPAVCNNIGMSFRRGSSGPYVSNNFRVTTRSGS